MMIERNIYSTNGFVGREERERRLKQRSFTLWLTGLSASGKTTLARGIERKLFEMDYLAYAIDGDNIRHGLNRNLGFTDEDRKENIRRVAETAKLLNLAGLINIIALIAPFRGDRQRAGAIIGEDNFIEVFVKCSLAECERRDPKGLYRRARCGEIPNFTAIDSPYEEPESAHITICTEISSPVECIDTIMKFLESRKFISLR